MAIEVRIQHDYTRDALSIYAYSNDTGAARRTYYTVDIKGTLMVHTVVHSAVVGTRDAGDEIAPCAELMKALVAAATAVAALATASAVCPPTKLTTVAL